MRIEHQSGSVSSSNVTTIPYTIPVIASHKFVPTVKGQSYVMSYNIKGEPNEFSQSSKLEIFLSGSQLDKSSGEVPGGEFDYDEGYKLTEYTIDNTTVGQIWDYQVKEFQMPSEEYYPNEGDVTLVFKVTSGSYYINKCA